MIGIMTINAASKNMVTPIIKAVSIIAHCRLFMPKVLIMVVEIRCAAPESLSKRPSIAPKAMTSIRLFNWPPMPL